MHQPSGPVPPVLLLSLDWLRPKDPRVTLGHASILARLQAVEGLAVSSLSRAVNSPHFDRDALLRDVLQILRRREEDSVLAVGVYVWNDPVVRWLLSEVRRAGFVGRIILGGPQVSYAEPGIAGAYPEADLLVRGYGEDALARLLVPGEDPSTVPGVTGPGLPDAGLPAAVDLDTLPSPVLSRMVPVTPFMRWETQRGCVYQCSFCQHREAGARLRKSTLSSVRVAREIEALVAGGARDIAVLDPIFNSNPEAVAILRRFRELGYTGRLSLQSRFEMLSEDFLDACEGLDVRLEFGLQTVQDSEMRAVKRINRLERVEGAMAELARRGLDYEVSLIYGLPTQTLASFEDTVRWCLDRGVPTLKAFPLMLLRGTGLDRDRDRWGLVESEDEIPVVVESDSFTRAEWEEMRRIAECLEGRERLRGAA